jgi:hypothetical protein
MSIDAIIEKFLENEALLEGGPPAVRKIVGELGEEGAALIWFPGGRGLQLHDSLPDAKPDGFPFVIPAIEHFISTPCCHELSAVAVFADQEVRGSPDVAVEDHSVGPAQQVLNALGN